IPENSINSTALSAAYVANAHGADAAYFNPAAMVFNEDGGSMEVDMTYIHLSAIQYTDNNGIYADDASDVERFLVPTFHYVSPKMGNARFGLSVVAPAGLTKRWDGTGKASTQQFTLKTVEINPTAAYMFNNRFSAGVGARVVYSAGVVKSKLPIAPGVELARDLDGDSFDFGYNLALQFKATDNLDLALTYRSKIDLTVEGKADIVHPFGPASYDGDASVEVPIPAALNLAAAYTFNDTTTVELVYERTYWSAYKELDFNYDITLSTVDPDGGGPLPSAYAAFDASRPKNWKDSDSYRIGITHKYNSMWTFMAGYAYDKTPVPESTAGFELPDSDAHIFSLGARYQYSDNLNVGFGLLYDKKDKLKLREGNTAADSIDNADFEDASAILLTMGVQYTF
ncbi:MAG: aromatic hydrocarbon degradation protein, partial [Gammaproteobacteria bacterium]|nr:aromatic hydrocarbon degradation protein [Gammaproteobacteria bacterium]